MVLIILVVVVYLYFFIKVSLYFIRTAQRHHIECQNFFYNFLEIIACIYHFLETHKLVQVDNSFLRSSILITYEDKIVELMESDLISFISEKLVSP